MQPETAQRLGYYVYLYIDPRNGEVFYVGKGKGDRAIAHLSDSTESEKVERIWGIRAAGLEPRIDILVHGLPSEEAAFRIEAAVIDAVGVEKLTNKVRGFESNRLGRMPLAELDAIYGATPVVIEPDDAAILIRVNRLYRPGMSDEELYEVTRGVWRLGKRRESARYAMPVFLGVVREVYEIESWHRAGTTEYAFRKDEDLASRTNRWEFVGRLAPENVRARYVGRSVQSYFRRGQQSPVTYVNC